ncbi:hypothetical protein [Kingella oralis]|uniref:hypothetical protein n=1 Tax=Kingella oralis TaxID=505 RepID=UPI002D7ED6E6|nr:hypothetical protein [Kingella oralis]
MPTVIPNRFSGCLSQVVGSLKNQYKTTTVHRQKQCFNTPRQPENGFGIVETRFTHFRLPYAAQVNPTINPQNIFRLPHRIEAA